MATRHFRLLTGAAWATIVFVGLPAASALAQDAAPPNGAVLAEKQADAAQIAAIQAKLGSLETTGRLKTTRDAKSASSAANPALVGEGSRSGTSGDFWVSLMDRSGSIGFAGHAAIVSTNSTVTIESFAKTASPINKDGVQKYANTWGARTDVLMLRPRGATLKDFTAAATYAEAQVGDPYNWNFLDKMTEKSFYCSQLVWRAWLNQGIDIEKGSFPNGAVTPADLVNSTNTYVVFRR
ncbi:MAG: YiiX/YebB-like N1pC/P60 family cysteine hydrolase [Candidatus Nanopelagicales bacterium]